MNDEQETLARHTRFLVEVAQAKQAAVDEINHPTHYTQVPGVECIDVIEALAMPYHLGCALKYLWRWDMKATPKANIRKAIWYLERWLEVCDE